MSLKIKHGKAFVVIVEGGASSVMVGCASLDIWVTGNTLKEALDEFLDALNHSFLHYREKENEDLLSFGQQVKQRFSDVFEEG